MPGSDAVGQSGGHGGNNILDGAAGVGGGGGEGGYGAVVNGAGTHSNNVTIIGGTGGNAGDSQDARLAGGGDGGTGAYFRSGGTVTNHGTIAGGSGGLGGQRFRTNGEWVPGRGKAGAGGTGVVGRDLTITNAGTIRGGLSGDGVRGTSILFTGGANTLTFANSDSGLTGAIGVINGASLDFQQPSDAELTETVFGDGSVFKSGAGMLTLSGSNSYSGGTTVNGGILRVTSDAALGTGSVLVDGLDPWPSDTRLVFHGPDTSSGDLSIIIESGRLYFENGASAGNATIVNNETFDNFYFLDNSDAGAATIHNNSGGLYFAGSSTAKNAVIINQNYLRFDGTSTAGHAQITNNDLVHFRGNPSADDATIINVGGARIDISEHDDEISIGSVSGEGDLYLGRNTLTLGGLNQNDTIGGIIQDGGRGGGARGSLIKIGTGTLTVAGDNSYTGGTTIKAGTVDVVGGSISHADANIIVGAAAGDKGALQIHTGGTVESFNGIIGYDSGSAGAVLIIGEGSTLTLSNPLQVGRQGNGNLNIAGGGRGISTNPWASSIGSGSFSEGAMTITGAGSSWNSSSLVVADHGVGVLTVTDGGMAATTDGDVWIANRVGSTGTLNIGAAAADTPARAGVIETPSLHFGEGAGTLVFNHTGTEYEFATSLKSAPRGAGPGTSLVHHLAGTTLLTGNSAGFEGTTTVSGGMLLVGDSSGNGILGGIVRVEGNGVLGGSGQLTGDVTVDGTLSAGNSPGTLSIKGDLTLGMDSTSIFELNSPGVIGGTGSTGNDLVAVDGTLSLAGELEARVAAAGYYTLFTYGDLNGTFDSEVVAANGSTRFSVDSYEVRYGEVPGQVDLAVLAADQSMQFWDGANTSGDGSIDGGSGIWNGSSTNWTSQTGNTNAIWGGSVGIFAGNAGTVTVDGTQSFDTLQFSTDGYVLTGDALALGTDSGTFNVDTGVSATIESVVENGAGSDLHKAGNGTLVLGGANTYTGDTLISGGRLSVSQNANLGASSGGLIFYGGTLAVTDGFDSARNVALVGDGGFDVANGKVLVFSNSVSGAGDLIKIGNGELELTGTNSYGNTLVAAGYLVGTVDSISGNIGNAGTIIFDQDTDGTFTGDIVGLDGTDGAMRKSGVSLLTLEGGSSLDWAVDQGGLVSAADRFTGNVAIAAGASFTFDQGTRAAYSGKVSGGGDFVKGGTSALVLTGNSGSFLGATSVKTGTLVVNGTLGGSVNVLEGGRLEGNGTLGTTTVRTGATVAPGNSIGTLTVDGDITFASGSTYEVEVEPQGDSDLISASGTAFLQGASVLHISADGTYDPTSTYTILTAQGGIQGTFGAVSADFAFLDPTLSHGTNEVLLTLRRNDIGFAKVGDTFNQKLTGGGVDSLALGNAVYDAVVQLDDATARTAFDRLSGEIHASAKSALIEDSAHIRNAAMDRIRVAFEGVGTVALPVMAYGPGGAEIAPAATGRFAAWGQAFGSWGSFDGDGNAAGLDHDTGGLLVGMDGFVAETWRLGLIAGYSHSSFDAGDRASSGSSDNYHLGLYAGTQWDNLGLRSGLAYTWHDIETSRAVAFPGFSDTLSADYSAGTFQAFGELGYKIDTAAASIEPFANLAYVSLRNEGFTEEGGAAALTSHRQTTDATFTTLGLRAATGFDLGGFKAAARGMLGWRHAFGDTAPLSTHAFAGSDSFTVAGTPISEDAAVIEAGLDLSVTDTATFGIAYHGQIASDARQHGFDAKLNVKF